MADYIDRDWLYEQMNSTSQEFDLVDALEMIENFPAADVAPVVRCKDCRHWDAEGCGCSLFLEFGENDFCSYGERKEGAE